MTHQRTTTLVPLAALSALLLVLVAVIFWIRSSDQTQASLSTLLEPDAVKKIEIRPSARTATVGNEAVTRLQRGADGWILLRRPDATTGDTVSEEVPALSLIHI